MFFHLVNSEEALYIAVNAFKQEMECINKAKDQEEMLTLQKLAADDAMQMDSDIARYFRRLSDSYAETVNMFENLQTIEKLFKDESSGTQETNSLEDFISLRGQTFKENCH